MNDYNEKKEKKGGFLSALSGLLRGGSSAASGASGFGGAGGAAGGLGGLFATKAGVVGLVLGGATIAAGVGVVYNFIGPSSKPAYSPELFQNSYYEEEASKAGRERAQSRDASAASSSTLDMFREQARKDGIGLEGESASGETPEANANANSSAQAPSADGSAPGAPGADGAAGGAPRLQAAAGFGSKGGGGGSGTSIPRMQGGGGLSGGIGNQFSSVYRPPAQNTGKVSGMSASAARVKGSPRYAVPNFNRKGAFGQAKAAKKMGNMARFSSDSAAKGQAGIPFDSSEQAGSGDVGTPATGSGLGGAGVSNGANLKSSDPSLSSNDSTPPKVPDPENVSPWQKWVDIAMYAMLAAAALILITKILANVGKANPLALKAAMITAYLAMAAAGMVVVAGLMLMSKYGQKWSGIMYMITGAGLIYAAYQALQGVGQAANENGVNMGKMGEGCPGYDSNTAASNFKGNAGEFKDMWGSDGYTKLNGGEVYNANTNQVVGPGGSVKGALDPNSMQCTNTGHQGTVVNDGKPVGTLSGSEGPGGKTLFTHYTPSTSTTTEALSSGTKTGTGVSDVLSNLVTKPAK